MRTVYDTLDSPITVRPDAAVNFMNPTEVLADTRFTDAEKRDLLASWASDARAVPSAPTLRQLDNGAVIRVEEILEALGSLDAREGARDRARPRRSQGRVLKLRKKFGAMMWRKRPDDDDDDPPPCPAIAAGPLRGPLAGGEAVDAVALAA